MFLGQYKVFVIVKSCLHLDLQLNFELYLNVLNDFIVLTQLTETENRMFN